MPEFILQLLQNDFVKLTIALLITFPIAYDREKSTQIMGLRTYPLVALATCGYVLISFTFIDANDSSAQARIVQGILAGIGFIGGAAILKKEDRVKGTATAASVWATGAIGIAAAYARYDIAIFLALAVFIILHWFPALKDNFFEDNE
ncbi:MAG: MgtC/SapB family protein [Anaerolineae bacterium]|nr:MgtC/SapB family protein [Anaerolineae bacterium]